LKISCTILHLQNPLWVLPIIRGALKLRSSGYRLVYEVKEEKIVIVVLAVGKRENSDIYNSLAKRVKNNNF